MEYQFRTESGHVVEIKTVVSKKNYFGIYTTCRDLNVQDRWSTLCDSYLRLMPGDDMCPGLKIQLPDDVAESLTAEKLEACSRTGKIIIATVLYEDGREYIKEYGTAIAEPIFKSMVWYRMPKEMERSIRLIPKDGRIFDMGGIEVDPEESEKLYVTSSRGDNYQFVDKYIEENDVWKHLNIVGLPEGKDEIMTIHLEVRDLYSE